MTQEDKQLLLKDLCERLPYEIICEDIYGNLGTLLDLAPELNSVTLKISELGSTWTTDIDKVKPYLRSLSTMTSEEAKDIAFLWGIDTERILNLSVSEKYIDIIIDDGFCSTETITIWFEDIVSSIKVFDYLNFHHLDYRGLIPRLAIEAPKGMYRFNK